MKYRHDGTWIPAASRKSINEKILYLVEQNSAEQSGITRSDIFSAYTGDGGLHGLDRRDFTSYHDFSEAKKEIENGQFFTPDWLCRFVMSCIQPNPYETVADLTAGIAGFCNYMPAENCFYGCELDIKAFKVSRYLYPDANLTCGDIRAYQPSTVFDYIVGNPPFNLKWTVDDKEYLSQLYYCVKAFQSMKPLGIMALIVPESFLADDFSDGTAIKTMESMFDFLGQFSIPADSFRQMGVSSFPTKVMFWQRRLDNAEDSAGIPYSMEVSPVLRSADFADTVAEQIRNTIIKDAKQRIAENVLRIRMELANGNNDPFRYQVRKMLYHIKSNPKTVEKYPKCQEYLYRFEHQECPVGMKYEEWSKNYRITEAKVLAYLRRAMKITDPTKIRDEIKLIKQDYGFVYKAYSPKMARQLDASAKTPVPIHQIVSNLDDPADFAPYARLIRRKQRDFQNEMRPIREMADDPAIAEYLDSFMVYDSENEEEIRLNNTQKHDLNRILQKRFHLLQWEQGGGKTLAGIATGMYRMKFQHAPNVWVVSTAISIYNNWELVLKNYGLPFRTIKRIKDLDAIQPGEFLLITLEMLTKYRKQVKRTVRIHGQRDYLVFDESDEMTNPSSKRSKAVLDCFRRLRYKLGMSGTITRNNVAESAPQFELLYNNSYNMICNCETVYSLSDDDESAVISASANPYFGSPFPAYSVGYSLFSACFVPEKITVFGVGKHNQDIYNADVLDEMNSHTITTRTLSEIMGREIRKPHQVTVSFSPMERAIYSDAIKKFDAMRSLYFRSTNNARKDAMMKLIQQITLLLRISAAPNTMAEYTSEEVPVKIQKVLDMVESWPDEPVVIGVRHKIVVDAYADAIRQRMPGRKLFVVTGTTTSLAKRRALKKSLAESGNGILVCTQQSFPSSVNMEFVNKIIIPELHYNNARMSQFYHRFIRFTSQHDKDIYFVTYAGSIESNQMQMVLAKEKLNLFMKGKDVDLDDVYKRFGVDYDLLSLLMRREEDDDGKLRITWGEQLIS